MKTVLITGGAGCIGSALCKRLLNNGYKVIAVDNLITSDGNNLKTLKKHKLFTFIEHDIIHPFATRLSPDFIYHLACPTGVPNLSPLAEEMLLACSIGTRNVLELARRNKSKVVFTSSSEVYGNPKIFPQDEKYTGNVSTTDIRSPYEEGKRFSESLCAMYKQKYKVNVKIVRVFNTYGPESSNKESRVIPMFLRIAKKNKPIPVQGNGKQTRTFCYVDDLVDGLLLVMSKGKSGEVYNIGSDKEVKIIDLARIIIKQTGSKSKIVFTPRPSHDHSRRLPNLSKIKKLGWKNNVSLNEGLKVLLGQM